MVLGVVMIAAMVPTMIGLNEATQGSRQQEEDRLNYRCKARTHLVATVSLSQGTQQQRQQSHNATVQVGRGGKLYITKEPASTMVPYNGGFYSHPEFPPTNTSGLVTISGEETLTLHWVFLDAVTREMRWGGRPDSEGHVCGPFDWSQDETYVTLDGWEGWLAVRLPEDDARDHTYQELGIDEGRDVWRLYFDQNDDGADLPPGAQGLEIRLKRVMAES
ncbi:hypothetical protein N7523_002905 [Penicillium sp. IBT 18751x]|nr:hypothetical protein N7523_002905 [Penicillium sp. IBT 18751x]